MKGLPLRMLHRFRDAVPVIDVFAGPGGLGEGFSALHTAGGEPAFRIALSIEMDALAHWTLTLRSFYRQFPPGDVPEDYYLRLRGKITHDELLGRHPDAAAAVAEEAWCAELGNEESAPRETLKARVKSVLQGRRDWVLIGGPPCQAYSLAGRSRNRGKVGYRFDDDPRARLYVQYLHLIAAAWPAAFVMENVPGLLSASMGGKAVFDMIRRDLRDPAAALGLSGGRNGHTYTLHAIAPDEADLFDSDRPDRFVVRCERFGVPQRRRRVVLVGLRDDMHTERFAPLTPRTPVTVREAIGDLPLVRSGLSKEPDSADAWLSAVTHGLTRTPAGWRDFARAATFGGEWLEGRPCIQHERGWFVDERLGGFCNHSTRTHIRADLWRYRFAAQFGDRERRSPSLTDFAKADPKLLPRHANVSGDVESVAFADRSPLRAAEKPATRVTSHIGEEGYYAIHHGPMH